MQPLNFSQNWNRKLVCHSFTTIRPYNTDKYQKGNVLMVHCRSIESFKARVVDMRKLKFSQINEYISRIDSGYDLESFKKLLRSFYKEKASDMDYSFVLLERMESEYGETEKIKNIQNGVQESS